MTKVASRVDFKTITQSVGLNDPGEGVLYMMGPTQFGEHYNPELLIANKSQFKRHFGGRLMNSNFPLFVERALDAGVKVRVARVPAGSAPVSEAENDVLDTNDNPIFSLKARGSGSYYSDITYDLEVMPSSLPVNLKLTITLGSIVETYIFETPTSSSPDTYLDEVIQNSELVTVEYKDLSGITTPIALQEYSGETFTSVTDSTNPPALLSYTDNLEVFDEYFDGVCIVVPDELPDEADKQLLGSSLSTYAANREDLVAVIGAPPTTPVDEVITYFSGITPDSTAPKFTVFTRGGLRVIDEGSLKTITESVDVAANFINQYNERPWISPSGLSYGALGNVYGLHTNLGTPGKYDTLNTITQEGINSVVRKNNTICLWNAYTMAPDTSQDRFLNVVMLEIYLKRVIVPTMDAFLSEPNDPDTWLTIFYRVKPLLDQLVEERAAYEVEWKGDQFVDSLDNLEINDVNDVQNGEYKAILEAKLISPIVLIKIEFYKQSLNS